MYKFRVIESSKAIKFKPIYRVNFESGINFFQKKLNKYNNSALRLSYLKIKVYDNDNGNYKPFTTIELKPEKEVKEYKNCYFYSNDDPKEHITISYGEGDEDFFIFDRSDYEYDIKIIKTNNEIEYIDITRYSDSISRKEFNYRFYPAEDGKIIQ